MSAGVCVAAGRTVATNKAIGEAGNVEPFRWVVIEVVGIADSVRPRAGLRARKLQPGERVERVARLNGHDAIGLPSAQHRVQDRRARRAELPSVPVRQVVGVAGNEAVAGIEGRQTPLQTKIRDVHDRTIPQRGVSIDLEKVYPLKKLKPFEKRFSTVICKA